MNYEVKKEIYFEVLDRLIKHLQKRNDVQNIDLMNLSGFCRNCLSKWFVSAASKRKLVIDYDKAREIIYGMPYEDWKKKYQTKATKEQIEKYKENNS